jgi:transposase
MFVPVDLSTQLLPGTLESVINEAIDRMNITKFEQRFKNQETGAPAYNPRILLKIILYAYSRGIISSRKIAEAAENHITFIALSGYSKPDFTTIANFVSSMQEEISIVFLHVLRLCDKMQLVGGERFAIDGHKLSANAAKEWSGTQGMLQKKLVKMKDLIDNLASAHKITDSEEKKSELAQKKSKLAARAKRIENFLANNEPKKATRKGAKEIQSNVTDNESAKIISAHGVIQGYNGIAVADAKNQVL